MKSLKSRVEYRIVGKNNLTYGGYNVTGPKDWVGRHSFMHLKLGKTEFYLPGSIQSIGSNELRACLGHFFPSSRTMARLLTVRLKDYKIRQEWMVDDMWELTKRR